MAYVILPNGSGYPIQEGQTPQEAMSAALRQYPEAFGFAPTAPKEDTSGATAAAKSTVARTQAQFSALQGRMGLKTPEEAKQEYDKYMQESQSVFKPTEDSWATSPGLKLREALGGMAPLLVAPVAAGIGASAAVPAAAGAGLAALAGFGAATAAGTGQFTLSNIGRQVEEGTPIQEVKMMNAVGTALPQALLDTGSMYLMPGIGKFLGMAGKKVTEASAKELAEQTFKKMVWDYTKANTKAATVESVTESAQQVLERMQAGLSTTDPQAREEYEKSATDAAAVALALGPFGRFVERGQIKAQGKNLEEKRLGEERAVAEAKQAEERTAAQAAQAEADAAEAERKQQPEYLRNLTAQYRALEQEKQTLPKIEKPKKVKDASAEQELAYEDALKTYEESVAAKKGFIERYKPVKQEYLERRKDIQALQAEDQTQEAMQGGAGPMAQPTLPGFELGGQQPGAAEQIAAEQDRALYGAEAKQESARQAFGEELAPAYGAEALPEQPSTLTPVQQRVGLMQQRDTLAETQKQLQARIADVNIAPQERVALGRQAAQVTTALKDINAQLPTLDKLQKQEATLTTQLAKATKAKAIPQAQAISARLQAVQQQISAFAAPAMDGQGALDLRPPEAPVAEKPLPKAKTERGGQSVLPGFQPQGVQATAPTTETATAEQERGLYGAEAKRESAKQAFAEQVRPEFGAEAAPVAPATAEDLTDDIRKLELLAKRQYEKVAASTLETFPTENKKAEAIRARIQELEQQQESAPKKVPPATEADVAAREERVRTLEEGVAKAEKDFYEAKDKKGDFAQAAKFRNSWGRLTEKLAAARAEPVPQVQTGVAAQPGLIAAAEEKLATEVGTKRAAAVAQRRAGAIAEAKAKADVAALAEKASTPELVREERVKRQQEVAKAQQKDKNAAALERKKQAEQAAQERHQRRVELQNAKRGKAAKPAKAAPTAAQEQQRKVEEAPKAETKAEPKAEPKAAPKAKTAVEALAKAEAETKKLAQEQPDLFDDANFDSDTDTASDAALREDEAFYEGRPTTDLSEAARDAAEDGNVADLLTELTKSKNALHREIATRLQTLMSGLGRRPKITVEDNLMDNGKRVEGYYTASKNRITLDRESLTEETTLHELVHAVTLGMLRADPSTLTTEQRTARADLERIFNKIKNDPAFAKEYGTVNLEEFAAEVLTNSQLRDKLNQQKADGKSLLQSIYQALMRLIGLDPDSMAAEAVEATFKLFQPPMVGSKDSVAIPSVMRGVFPGTKAVAAASVDPGVVNTVSALVGRSATVGDKITASAVGLRLRTKIADKWAPIEELLKQGIAKGEVKAAQAMQLRFLMRVSEDTSRLVSMAINDAVPQLVRGADGVRTLQSSGNGVNAKKLANALSGSKLGNARFVEDLFTSWLAILRAESDGIGYNKLNYGNDKEGNPILNAEKAQAIKNMVESDPATKKAFAEARSIYKQYNKDLLTTLVKSGYLSQEKANDLLKGDYVPYYRINGGIVELQVGGGKKINIGSVVDQPQLKELVGGEDKILPIFSGMVQNTSLLMRSAVRNMQMRDVGNMLQDMGMAKIIKGEGPRDVYTARFKKNGEDYYVRLDESAFPGNVPAEVVIMGLQGIKTAIPAGVELMQIPVKLLRKGITRMPTYAIRQLLRDPVHAWMTTGGDFSVLIDTYKEFFKSLKSATPTELSLQRAGAISSNVQHLGSQEDVATMLRDITSGKSGWNINGILAKLDTLGMKADAATRSAVYNNYRKKGLSHTEAILGTAESMNFSRRGTSASLHWLSTMIPFFNAQIQGLDSVYRAGVKGDTVFQDKLDVRAKLIKRGALMAGMTLAYAVMMQDDEAYKNATPFERAQSWFVHIPGVEEPIKIPIPFELGLVFKTVPEMAYSTAFGDTKARDARDAMGKLLVQAQPIGLPAGIKPLIELAANYNFFADAPIIGQREQGLTTDQQFRNSTSELAKLLGKTGAVSPLSVDHLIRSYTGGLGMLLVQMGDYPLRPFVSPDAADKPTKNLNEMPVFGSMFQPSDGRGIINAAFKDIEQFQKAATAYQSILKSGNRAEAAAFADKYARDIALTSVGGSFKQKMGELASLKRQITSMPGMSSDEKQAQIKSIRNLEIQLATMIRQVSSAP